MAYNTSFTRFKSGDLAGLDCGSYLKSPRRDRKITLVAAYDGDIEVGQCVAMVRVPANARITSANLSWAGTSETVLGVGDPYACGRLSTTAIHTITARGNMRAAGVGVQGDCAPYGSCGTLVKCGITGDGCGLFYQYTCETDIIVTNLYSERNHQQGGWGIGNIAAGAGKVGAKWTGGRLVLEVTYLPQS